MDARSLGNDPEDKPMSTYMLDDIHDGSHSYLSINKRE